MVRIVRIAAAVLAAACNWSNAGAQTSAPVDTLSDGRSGKVHFESLTPRGYFQLARGEARAKATVFGTLLLPPTSTGRVPAMVVAHGSAGVSETRETRWAKELVAAGMAAFVVDSFTPRNIRQTATDQSQLSTAANLADALAALRLVATHPGIDADRIGIIGFSKGGQVALYSMLEPYRRAVMQENAARFAAHVALYPYCNEWHIARQVTTSPLLLLLGGRDDYTPAQPCLDYADWLRSQGATATPIVYPQAHHNFDSARSPAFVRELVTGRACSTTIDLDRFVVKRRDSGEDITATARVYSRDCLTRGATIGGDGESRRRAQQDVRGFLKTVFKL
jgi:dienelactone hydrolase